MIKYTNFITENKIKLAKKYIEIKFKNKTRKITGIPYKYHLLATFKTVRKHGGGCLASQIAAILHDVIEDTDTTKKDIIELFGEEVYKLVKELTSDEKAIAKMGKGEYLTMKMNKMSSEAFTVKLADRLNNLMDLVTASNKWSDKYYKQTKNIIAGLTRKITSDQKKIIDRINKKLEFYETNRSNK